MGKPVLLLALVQMDEVLPHEVFEAIIPAKSTHKNSQEQHLNPSLDHQRKHE
jgi:hypothetical protein